MPHMEAYSAPDGVVKHLLGEPADESRHEAGREPVHPELHAHVEALMHAVHAMDSHGVAIALKRAHEHLSSRAEDEGTKEVDEKEGLDEE